MEQRGVEKQCAKKGKLQGRLLWRQLAALQGEQALANQQQPLKTETRKQAIFYGDSNEQKKSAM